MAYVGDIRNAVIDSAAGGNLTIVAAVPGKRIYVFGYVIVASGAVTVQWKSGTTAMSGPMALAANGGLFATGSPDTQMFATAAGDALILTPGSAVQVSGHLTYGVH